MPPTSVTSDPWKVSPVGPEEIRKEGCVLLFRPTPPSLSKGTRKKVPCAKALHPFYLTLPTPGVLIEIEGESFRCVCGVGSYLIHSPWVLPTPRGDYSTANGGTRGSNTVVMEGRREQRDARHTRPLWKSMSRPEDDPNRSCIGVACRYSVVSRRRTRFVTSFFFFLTDITCYDIVTITEITSNPATRSIFSNSTRLFQIFNSSRHINTRCISFNT